MGQLADAARAFFPVASRLRAAREAPDASPPPRSDFGRRLLGEPPDRRLAACFDLFVYWLACADERPEPKERARLLAADPRELGRRESAKRAAWAEDVHAFADAVHATIDAAGRDRRAQLLELLLLVRFCEGERGGAENLVVRFLADVLGVRGAELDRLYRDASGTAPERLPRLDPDDWWLTPADDDEPSVSDEGARHRRRLGLAQSGPIEAALVDACFERRLALADPSRFDRLGAHERRVAGRLRTRLVEARDALSEEVMA